MTQSSRMGTVIFNAKIRTKINTKPMTAPTRSFFAFSPEFCSSALEIFTPRKMQ